MDPFLSLCSALGLGLGAGAIVGAAGSSGRTGSALLLIGAILGAAVAAVVVGLDGHSPVGAGVLGALAGGFSALVTGDVARGAARRAAGQSLAAMIAGAGALVAALSVVVPPVSLPVGVATVWLFLSRRRRAARKHEGLRILR